MGPGWWQCPSDCCVLKVLSGGMGAALMPPHHNRRSPHAPGALSDSSPLLALCSRLPHTLILCLPPPLPPPHPTTPHHTHAHTLQVLAAGRIEQLAAVFGIGAGLAGGGGEGGSGEAGGGPGAHFMALDGAALENLEVRGADGGREGEDSG